MHKIQNTLEATNMS